MTDKRRRWIIVRSGPGDREALEEAARLTRKSMSWVFRQAVREYLTNLKKGRRK